ncbi:thiamine pyrophosphate-binding protein [Terrarubrum flagellatum]|uniref:thiamine pyrophosphate-binding protein n=1 Tax=Terrirubrum flagellatum TaxID=2895980 RepID=UPI0031450ABC
MKTGGQLIVDSLIAQGVEHVFCVPGESYLAVLDALHDASINVTVCRQEGGATMMADASARLTGRPGVVMVTRGPGATNASPGIHIAEHDSVPLVMFVGQIDGSMRHRGAFQEMDYRAFFGSTAKWVVEIDDAARIPEHVSRAFHVAMQGRPGPVIVALPEDVLSQMADAPQAKRVEPVQTWPGLTQMAELQKLLWAAERPIAILGGSGWSEKACASFARFSERFELPVACSFRRQMLFSGDHPNYAGEIGIAPNPKLRARIDNSDLVLLVGGRMAEMPSQSYELFSIPYPKQTFVHVHADSNELGRVYHPTLGIHASPAAFAASLESLQPPQRIPWAQQTAEARADYLAWNEAKPIIPGDLQMAECMAWLRGRLPADAIITNGAGNYATWPARFLKYRSFGCQLAPCSGSMGYGAPAAVGAKRVEPDRMVVAFAGDGCFLMNGQEFATAVQYDLNVIFVVVDNGMYGTIRMHQEREFPGRVSATMLKNPDFAAYARAFGGHGETVRTTAEFAPAFERAIASNKPAILHCFIDPEAITPGTTLTKMREAAQAAKK